MKNIGYNCSSNDISLKQMRPKQENGLYGLESNNEEIDASNQEINSVSDQIRGEFQWSNVYVLNYGLEANNIRQDGVHPNIYEFKK